jgi:hypothetical protein
MKKSLDELPGYLDLTHSLGCEHLESGYGQVNGVLVFTSGAIIRNGHGDSLAIVCSDLHPLPAKRRNTTRIAIQGLIFDGSEFHCDRFLRDTHPWRK